MSKRARCILSITTTYYTGLWLAYLSVLYCSFWVLLPSLNPQDICAIKGVPH